MENDIIYDEANDRLLYLKERSTNSFWDKQWLNLLSRETITRRSGFSLTIKKTRKYLPKGSFLLEGGCGIGRQVYLLEQSGYASIGIDYAHETIRKAKAICNNLRLAIGDVERLPFKNDTFDGYWSYGVIEHVYEGYDRILNEMKRVIRKNGFVFLSFPAISWYRRIRIEKKIYNVAKNVSPMPNDFYQFCFNPRNVIAEFEKTGFKLREKTWYGAVKGIKDSDYPRREKMQRLYDSKKISSKLLKYLLEIVLGRWCSHNALLVFQKK